MKNEKVITEFTELANVLNSNETNINELVWKGKDGKEVRLMDMKPEELQKAYNHALDMLYNNNKYTPGRIQVKKNIKHLICDCNAELLMRYILHDCDVAILKTNIQLIEFIRNSKSVNKLSDDDSVSTLFTSLPTEFESVTVGQLLNACFDKLDFINRKMISDNFIVSQGIWLTESEKEDLTEYDSAGKMRPWLDVIKERLLLNDVKLRVDPSGFSYNEFRCLVHLEPLSRISRLSSDTLRLLRDKVFLLLDIDTDYHIEKWNTIKTGIEKVAEYRDIKLVQKTY